MEQRLQGFESGAKIQGTLVLLDEYPSIRDGHVGFFLTLYHFQMWTKGGLDGENLVILGINQCRSEEEGVSSLFITKMMNIASIYRITNASSKMIAAKILLNSSCLSLLKVEWIFELCYSKRKSPPKK